MTTWSDCSDSGYEVDALCSDEDRQTDGNSWSDRLAPMRKFKVKRKEVIALRPFNIQVTFLGTRSRAIDECREANGVVQVENLGANLFQRVLADTVCGCWVSVPGKPEQLAVVAFPRASFNRELNLCKGNFQVIDRMNPDPTFLNCHSVFIPFLPDTRGTMTLFTEIRNMSASIFAFFNPDGTICSDSILALIENMRIDRYVAFMADRFFVKTRARIFARRDVRNGIFLGGTKGCRRAARNDCRSPPHVVPAPSVDKKSVLIHSSAFLHGLRVGGSKSSCPPIMADPSINVNGSHTMSMTDLNGLQSLFGNKDDAVAEKMPQEGALVKEMSREGSNFEEMSRDGRNFEQMKEGLITEDSIKRMSQEMSQDGASKETSESLM